MGGGRDGEGQEGTRVEIKEEGRVKCNRYLGHVHESL